MEVAAARAARAVRAEARAATGLGALCCGGCHCQSLRRNLSPHRNRMRQPPTTTRWRRHGRQPPRPPPHHHRCSARPPPGAHPRRPHPRRRMERHPTTTKASSRNRPSAAKARSKPGLRPRPDVVVPNLQPRLQSALERLQGRRRAATSLVATVVVSRAKDRWRRCHRAWPGHLNPWTSLSMAPREAAKAALPACSKSVMMAWWQQGIAT